MADEDVIHLIHRGTLYELRGEPGGGYTISVPLLPGCFSFGETIDEALEQIQQAISLWVEGATELGYDVPDQFVMKQAS